MCWGIRGMLRVKEVSRKMIMDMLWFQDELSETNLDGFPRTMSDSELNTNLVCSFRFLRNFLKEYLVEFPEEFEWIENLRRQGYLVPIIDRFGV